MTMHRKLVISTTAVVALSALVATSDAAVAAHRTDHRTSPTRVLIEWNHAMTDNLRATLTPGPVGARDAAIVQASVFDAVNGITDHYQHYFETRRAPDDASPAAAAIGAAHEALLLVLPTQQASLDALLERTVRHLSDEKDDIAHGLAWGKQVADDISAWRANDGFTTVPPPYVPTPLPGRWQPTPPLFGPPAFRQFATMVPFAIKSPDQFQPGPPPALTSARYAKDFAETKAYGSLTSTRRSPYGTETALLWQSDSPMDLWDPVADTLIIRHHLGLTEASRLLAQISLAMGDATIAIWQAKNHYDTWRPITAIEQAATDGNPATHPDPNWQPLLTTPSFQEYPSGHCGASQTAAAVLAHRFGNHTSFAIKTPNSPGVVHSFRTFTASTAEVTDARVYGGIHFRFSCDVAEMMGHEIVAYVLKTQMRPLDD